MTDARTIPTISPDDVARLRSEGRPVDLIDVRTPMEYADVHAEGARLVPLDRLDPAAVMASRTGRADEPLFVICRSGPRAAKACEAFRAAGFRNVLNVVGGTDAWERRGPAVVRGRRRVISLERQVRIAAGLLVVTGVLLGWLLHPVFYAISAFVGAGLVFAGVTDTCGMGMLLARMPWNRPADDKCAMSTPGAGGNA
jgi:rhodanese-related sulfurtransferase